jgi:hypothetical protein
LTGRDVEGSITALALQAQTVVAPLVSITVSTGAVQGLRVRKENTLRPPSWRPVSHEPQHWQVFQEAEHPVFFHPEGVTDIFGIPRKMPFLRFGSHQIDEGGQVASSDSASPASARHEEPRTSVADVLYT